MIKIWEILPLKGSLAGWCLHETDGNQEDIKKGCKLSCIPMEFTNILRDVGNIINKLRNVGNYL